LSPSSKPHEIASGRKRANVAAIAQRVRVEKPITPLRRAQRQRASFRDRPSHTVPEGLSLASPGAERSKAPAATDGAARYQRYQLDGDATSARNRSRISWLHYRMSGSGTKRAGELKCAPGTHSPISSAKNKNAQRLTFVWSELKCARLGTPSPISSAKNRNAQRPTFACFAPYPGRGGRCPRRLRRDRDQHDHLGCSCGAHAGRCRRPARPSAHRPSRPLAAVLKPRAASRARLQWRAGGSSPARASRRPLARNGSRAAGATEALRLDSAFALAASFSSNPRSDESVVVAWKALQLLRKAPLRFGGEVGKPLRKLIAMRKRQRVK
jgi:hypothetical protein